MVKDVLIGTIGSIVASIVIAVFLSVYEINGKEKYRARLSMIRSYARIISIRYSYKEDYAEIIHCAEEIIRLVREIGDHVRLLNRFSKTRKIFFTVLYDLEHRCERICFQTAGYAGEEEIEVRIAKIEKEQFSADECILCREVDLLGELLNGDMPDISVVIIDENSYRQPKDHEYIRQYGVTAEEFRRYVVG